MKQRYFLPLLTFPQPCTEGFLSRAISLARHQDAVLHAVVFDIVQPGDDRLDKTGDVMTMPREDTRRRVETLLSAAERQAGANNVELVTDWLDIDRRRASRVITEASRGHDLVLLESSRYNSAFYDVSEALIVHSGAPCLVLPPAPFSGHFHHVVIAWDGSDNAERAVGAAEAFIKQAIRVTVMVIAGEKKMPEVTMLHVVEQLRSRGSTVDAVVVPGEDSGEGVQLNALNIDGNLLVMGGFGRSRLRETLFGGTTADVIRNTLMPVMLAH